MSEQAIIAHEDALMAAFAEVLKAEEAIRVRKVELQETTQRLGHELHLAETALAESWQGVSSLLAETGEVEVILPGSANDYKIGWSSPRESVKVADADAVPDSFVKLERKPKLKEIGDHLRDLIAHGGDLPNWGRFELGERKLGWKAVKKGVA